MWQQTLLWSDLQWRRRAEELGNNHNQLAQRRDIICSQLCPCFMMKRSCTECSRTTWAMEIWTIPGTADTYSAGAFFFPAKIVSKCCLHLSGRRLLSAMQCSLPVLMWWLRDNMSSGRWGLCVTKTRMWVGACLPGCGTGLQLLGNGTSYKLVRITPALAPAGAQDSACATASSGMSPQAGNMPGLHGRSGSVWIKCLPSLLVLLSSCFVPLRIQKMPPMYIPQYRPLPEKKLELIM